MKHCLLLILSAAGLPAALLAQLSHLDIRVPDRADTDLTGPVQRVELDVCINVSGEHTKALHEYDRTGNLLQSSAWDSEQEPTETTTYFYDEHGCLERQLYENFEEGYTNDWAVVLNPETRQIGMKNSRTGSVALETYSPEKHLLHFRLVDRDRKQISASRSKRNESNQRTEFTRYDSDNHAEYTYFFKWKENGFIDRERQRFRQEKKERLHTYEYLEVDDVGNWTQQLMVRYDIGGREKEKVFDQMTVRKLEYFDSEETRPETDAGPDNESMNGSSETETAMESPAHE